MPPSMASKSLCRDWVLKLSKRRWPVHLAGQDLGLALFLPALCEIEAPHSKLATAIQDRKEVLPANMTEKYVDSEGSSKMPEVWTFVQVPIASKPDSGNGVLSV